MSMLFSCPPGNLRGLSEMAGKGATTRLCLLVPRKNRVHVIADAISEIVADQTYLLESRDQGTAVADR